MFMVLYVSWLDDTKNKTYENWYSNSNEQKWIHSMLYNIKTLDNTEGQSKMENPEKQAT